MTTRHFSTGDALQFGWSTLRTHLAPLLLLGGAGLVLAMFSQALGRSGAGGALFGIVVQAAQVAVTLVMLRVGLRLYDGEAVDLFDPGPLLQGYWYFLAATFLYGLVVSVGLLLLIVPGVLWGLTFCFAPLFTAGGQHDLVEAFRESSRLTRGSRAQLLGLGAALIGLNLLGVLALGVGTVITVPMSMLAAVYAFRRMQGRIEAAPAHVPTLTPRSI